MAEKPKKKLTKPQATGVKAVVCMRFDPEVLRKIDIAARRRGMSRTAWLHYAASTLLGIDDAHVM